MHAASCFRDGYIQPSFHLPLFPPLPLTPIPSPSHPLSFFDLLYFLLLLLLPCRISLLRPSIAFGPSSPLFLLCLIPPHHPHKAMPLAFTSLWLWFLKVECWPPSTLYRAWYESLRGRLWGQSDGLQWLGWSVYISIYIYIYMRERESARQMKISINIWRGWLWLVPSSITPSPLPLFRSQSHSVCLSIYLSLFPLFFLFSFLLSLWKLSPTLSLFTHTQIFLLNPTI